MSKKCGFCGTPTEVCGPLIHGDVTGESAYICVKCVDNAFKLISRECDVQENSVKLTPVQLKAHLDEYVIGQDNAKKAMSVGVYNHYARIDDKDTEVELDKSNIMLVGPTGVGKSYLAQTLARKLNVPFAIGDATTITEAGYVGEDVENLLLKLIHSADGDISKAERGIIYIDEIDKIRKTSANTSLTRDVSGEGVQQSLLKMIEGADCNVPPSGGRKHPEMEYLKVNTKNILFICGGTFVGLEDIISQRVGKRQIGFNINVTEKEKNYNELIKKVTSDDLVEYGMIPEFVGRLPIIVPLNQLTEEDLLKIITEPKNALAKQYQKMVRLANGSELIFTDEALKEIARLAKVKETGARGLRSVFESFMIDFMYKIPSELPGKYVVDKDFVLGKKFLEFKEAA